MKSRGMFPSRGGGREKNLYGGSAGNSASNNRRTSNDGYKEGALGGRASPAGGGQRIADKLSERPAASDKAMAGAGGCAWDSSMKGVFNPREPAHSGKMR